MAYGLQFHCFIIRLPAVLWPHSLMFYDSYLTIRMVLNFSMIINQQVDSHNPVAYSKNVIAVFIWLTGLVLSKSPNAHSNQLIAK